MARPMRRTILPINRPTIARDRCYYREAAQDRRLVMFTVDAEANLGHKRIPNEEIAAANREQRRDDRLCQH